MTAMRIGPSGALSAAVAVAAGALVGACGSQTKTVSAPSTPPASVASTQTAQASAPTNASTTPASTTPEQTATNGGTPAPSGAHTAPEPAFTQGAGSSEGLSSAVAVLRARGFTPADTSDYHPEQALGVLVGTRSGSGDGYDQQAFFFVNGRFIGTDSSVPSATVKVVSQSDTEVTLTYSLYRHGDPLSNPSGGQAQVRFQLDNGKLVALDPIPSASPAASLSRQ